MKLLNARKKLVNLAVASVVAGGAAMVSAPASALNVSQNNIGQVHLYPYYTVKNGFDTLVSVVNTANRTVIFKIRFREALNSREVRDFNVILSPYDVWNATVTKDASGSGAVVRTKDNTCTSPIMPASTAATGAREIAFTTAGFDGTTGNTAYAKDGGGTDMTRVQEGYFELIAMAQSSGSTSNSTNTIEYNAKHDSAGVPRDCAKVDNVFATASASDYTTPAGGFSNFTTPGNVLKGFSSLINVANGTSVDMNPTHLENWLENGVVLAAPGDLTPSLANGTAVTPVMWFNNGAFVSAAGLGAEDKVSVALTATNVVNEYQADGTGVFTDWVITYPTKHFYTDLGPTMSEGDVPFTQNFSHVTTVGGTDMRGKSCDPITVSYWNREEKGNLTGSAFSPAGAGSQFCYEVNVLTFNGSYALGTGVNHLGLTTTDVGTKGWARIYQPGQTTSTIGLVTGLIGLPTIGFSAVVRSVGASSANYGNSEPHTYERSL